MSDDQFSYVSIDQLKSKFNDQIQEIDRSVQNIKACSLDNIQDTNAHIKKLYNDLSYLTLIIGGYATKMKNEPSQVIEAKVKKTSGAGKGKSRSSKKQTQA